MFKHRALFPAMIAAGLLAGGCTPAIHIIKPDRNNPFEPVTQAVVTFETKFNPGYGWSVDVDGANLGGFSPAPAPGGTSSVPLVVGAPGAHKITASASCGTFCVYNSDVVDFTPPALIYNSTSYVRVDQNLKQFQPASAYVGVQNFRTVPINVTIVETSFPKRVQAGHAHRRVPATGHCGHRHHSGRKYQGGLQARRRRAGFLRAGIQRDRRVERGGRRQRGAVMTDDTTLR